MDTLTALKAIPTKAAELQYLHNTRTHYTSNLPTTNHPTPPGPKPPTNLNQLTTLQNTLHQLSECVNLTYQFIIEGAIPAPNLGRQTPPTITTECQWLTRQAPIWQTDDYLETHIHHTTNKIIRNLDHQLAITHKPPLTCPTQNCGQPVKPTPTRDGWACPNGHQWTWNQAIERLGRLQTYTTRELANILNINAEQVYKWHTRGQLQPTGKRGRQNTYNLADATTLLNQTRQ